MLLNNTEGTMAGIGEVYQVVAPAAPMPAYDGFRVWHALLVDPRADNEKRALMCLARIGIVAYRPTFTKKIRRRGDTHAYLERAMIPGMLFVPTLFMQIRGRDQMLELCHAHDYLRTAGGEVADLTKGNIEVIREIEAKLNLPPPARAHDHEFKAGDEVTFRSLLYAANLGTGKVVALEGRDRIVVEVDKLFGRSTRVVVPAAEIEAK